MASKCLLWSSFSVSFSSITGTWVKQQNSCMEMWTAPCHVPCLSWLPSADSGYTDSSTSLPSNCEIWPYRENLTQFTDCPLGYRCFICHPLADALLTSDLCVHVCRAIKQWQSWQSQPPEESTSSKGRRLHPSRMVRTRSLGVLGYQWSVQHFRDEWLRITEFMNMLVICHNTTSFALFPFPVWIIFQCVNKSGDLTSWSSLECSYLKMGL